MKNINLTEEEFNLIINYRKGKYNIDITEDEYQMIVSHRNCGMKIYEKYIENIEKLANQENKFVSQKAEKLLLVAKDLQHSKISIDTYKKIEDITYAGDDEDTLFKIGCLNYIKNAITLHYPN